MQSNYLVLSEELKDNRMYEELFSFLAAMETRKKHNGIPINILAMKQVRVIQLACRKVPDFLRERERLFSPAKLQVFVRGIERQKDTASVIAAYLRHMPKVIDAKQSTLMKLDLTTFPLDYFSTTLEAYQIPWLIEHKIVADDFSISDVKSTIARRKLSEEK